MTEELDIREILKCVRCGTCRSVCPVFRELGWESTSARGRLMVAGHLLDGGLPDEAALASLRSCTTCAICREICPAEVDSPRLIEGARRELSSRGLLSEAQLKLKTRIQATGNSLGEARDRLAWMTEKEVPDRAEAVYFAGCLNSYRYPQVAAKTLSIIKPLGVTVLKNERCCGSPLLRTGIAPDTIDHNLEQIRATGAETVITGCAGCYTTLKKDYPPEFEVLSLSEFLEEHISDLKLEPLDITVTYHDPCHMGRHNRIFDPPRRVIEAICNLEEMKGNREEARCCGGGGGVRSGYPDLSLRMARRRLEDLPSNVETIVTTCPLCVKNLSDAGGKAIDLIDLVAQALPEHARGSGSSPGH